MEKLCSVCGSTMRVVGNEYVCSFCAHKEPISGKRKQDTTWKTMDPSSQIYYRKEIKSGDGNPSTNTIIALAIIGVAVFFIFVVGGMIFAVNSVKTEQQSALYDSIYEEIEAGEYKQDDKLDVGNFLKEDKGIRSQAMQKAVETMFQKPFDEVTKEDLESVKYIHVKYESAWEVENYEISYSFTDYQEYLSDVVNPEQFGYSEEFADTIQTFVYGAEDDGNRGLVYSDVCNFTGATAIYVDDYRELDLSKMKELRYVDSSEEQLSQLLECGLVIENIEILKLGREETLADLEKFSSLKKLCIDSYKTNNFSELGKCPNLETLCCMSFQDGSFIADIGELTNLKSLYLDCVSDEIKDVSKIANLSNLEHLTLINTEILNINFLAGFSGLKSLTLCENGQLRDFSVIGDLVNLESLHLDLNDLSGEQPEYQDIGKLKNLKRLQLDTVYDLDFLYQLPQLEELDITITFYNELLKPISMMSHLKNLKLQQCHYRNEDAFASLKALTELKTLSLVSMEIKESPDVLFQFNQLEELKIQNCSFDVAPSSVAANDKLKILDMSYVEFVTWPGPDSEYYYVGYNDPEIMNYVLSGFGNCTNLEEVYLDGCLVSDFAFLNNLSKLKVLSLERCELTEIPKDAFVGCQMLEELNLKDNTITNVEFAHCLVNLRKLNLENGYVTDLTPLLSCEKLEYINVKENPIYENPLTNVVVCK